MTIISRKYYKITKPSLINAIADECERRKKRNDFLLALQRELNIPQILTEKDSGYFMGLRELPDDPKQAGLWVYNKRICLYQPRRNTVEGKLLYERFENSGEPDAAEIQSNLLAIVGLKKGAFIYGMGFHQNALMYQSGLDYAFLSAAFPILKPEVIDSYRDKKIELNDSISQFMPQILALEALETQEWCEQVTEECCVLDIQDW